MPEMPADPFTYVGRLARDANGKAVSMEIFGPGDNLKVSDGDEFITFTTVMSLEPK